MRLLWMPSFRLASTSSSTKASAFGAGVRAAHMGTTPPPPLSPTLPAAARMRVVCACRSYALGVAVQFIPSTSEGFLHNFDAFVAVRARGSRPAGCACLSLPCRLIVGGSACRRVFLKLLRTRSLLCGSTSARCDAPPKAHLGRGLAVTACGFHNAAGTRDSSRNKAGNCHAQDPAAD
jgi:hypothetical protein